MELKLATLHNGYSCACPIYLLESPSDLPVKICCQNCTVLLTENGKWEKQTGLY